MNVVISSLAVRSPQNMPVCHSTFTHSFNNVQQTLRAVSGTVNTADKLLLLSRGQHSLEGIFKDYYYNQ